MPIWNPSRRGMRLVYLKQTDCFVLSCSVLRLRGNKEMRVLLLLCLVGVALASNLTKKGKSNKKSEPESIFQKTEETLSDVGKAENLEDEIERYNNLLTLMKQWRERLQLRTGRQVTDLENQTRIKNGRKKNIGGKKTKKSQKKKAKKKKQKKKLLKNKTQREILTPNKTDTTNGKREETPDTLSQISDRNNNLSKRQNLTVDKQKPQKSKGRDTEVSTNTETNNEATTVLFDEQPLDNNREPNDEVTSKMKHNDRDDEEVEISQADTPGKTESSENPGRTDTELSKSEETDDSRNDIEEHIDSNDTDGREMEVAEEDSNTNELKQKEKIGAEDDFQSDIVSEPENFTPDAVYKDIEDIPQPDQEESSDEEPQQSGGKKKETSNLQKPETEKDVANDIHGEQDENTKLESDIITERGHKQESNSKGRNQTSETDSDENRESAGTQESGNLIPADNDSETEDIPIQDEGKFSGKIKSGRVAEEGSSVERPSTRNKEEAQNKQIVPLENGIPQENLLYEGTGAIDTDLTNVKETDDNNDDIVEENDNDPSSDEEMGNVEGSSEGVTSENGADKSGEANGKRGPKHLIPEAMDVAADDIQPHEEELSNGAPIKGGDVTKDIRAEDIGKSLVAKQGEKDSKIAEKSYEHPTGTDIDIVMSALITDQDLMEAPENDASVLGSKGNTKVNDKRNGIRKEGKENQKHSAEDIEERDIGRKAHERTDRTGKSRNNIQNELDLSKPIHIRERQGDLDIEATNQEDDDDLNAEKRIKELGNFDKTLEEGRAQGEKPSYVKESLLNSKDNFDFEKKITDWIENTSSRPANVSYGSAVNINKRLDDFLEYFEDQSGDSEIDMTKFKRYIYELTQHIGFFDISKFDEIIRFLRENIYNISTSRLKQIIENLKIAPNNTKPDEESLLEKFREKKEEMKKKLSQIRERVNAVNETQESRPVKEEGNLDEKEWGGRALDEKPRYVKETILKRKDRFDFDEKLAGWLEKNNSSERPGNVSYYSAMYINKKLDDFIEYLDEQSEDSEIDMTKLKKYIYELAQHTGLLDTSKFKHIFRFISEYPRNLSTTRLKQTLESLKITPDKTYNENVLEKIKEKKEEIKKRISQIRENIKPINMNVFPSNATNVTTKNASQRFPLEIPSELRTRNGTYADIIRKGRNDTRNTTTENRNIENRRRIEIYHYSFKPHLSSNRTKPGNKTLPESNKYNQLRNDYIHFGRKNTTENNATFSNSSSHGRSNRLVQVPILRKGPTRDLANVSLPNRVPPFRKDITQANSSFPSQVSMFNASLPKQVPTLRKDIIGDQTNASFPRQVPTLGKGSTRGNTNASMPQQVPPLRNGTGRGRANPYLPKQVPTLRKDITGDQTNASFPRQVPILGKGSTRGNTNASMPQQVPPFRNGTGRDRANPYLPKQVSTLSIDTTRDQGNASLPKNVPTSGRGNAQEGANKSSSKQVPALKTGTSGDKVNSSLPKYVPTSGKGTSKVEAIGLNGTRPPVKTTQAIKKETRPAVSENLKKTGDITKVRRPVKNNVNSQTIKTADKSKTTGNVLAGNDGNEKSKQVEKTKNTLESKPTPVKTSLVKQPPTYSLGKAANGKTATKYTDGKINRASVTTKQAIRAGGVQVNKNVIPSRQNPRAHTKSKAVTNGRARVNRPSGRKGLYS